MPRTIRTVPFVDLRPQHEETRAEIEDSIRRIIDTSSFIGGEYVERFEREFAAFCGVEYAVGVGSGTAAVRIALQAAGVRPGDAVLTVSHTFIATAEAILQAGARPIFLDVDDASMCMSPRELARFCEEECVRDDDGVLRDASGSRIGAVLPVHLYGRSAEMDAIREFADRCGLPVVEDAAQAHGATYRSADGSSRPCGSMGRTAAFSFYPAKNLGAMGEAGAVVTSDPQVAEMARVLRNHGQTERNVHVTPFGSNERLDAIQAAVLLAKLQHVPRWNDERKRIARRYTDRLAAGALEVPAPPPNGEHVYHLYVIRVSGRERLRAALAEQGVATGVHYPTPVHLQRAFEGMAPPRGSLPNTEAAAEEVLSLPMYPHLPDDAVDYVADRVLELTAGKE